MGEKYKKILAGIAAGGQSYTLLVAGKVMACMGILNQPGSPNTAIAWVVVDKDIGNTGMVLLHRAAKRIIAKFPLMRLITEVRADFPQGHRWVKLLGFRDLGLDPLQSDIKFHLYVRF